ncbi:hypothetical protein HGRIS_011591 [Hohenbuehelia grisea]|uniref:Replication factor A protein 3 n=1 Tax=Hohenbuehelia grisea TaxID=104357 RepID=A0ABR3JVR1_9AGAR
MPNNACLINLPKDHAHLLPSILSTMSTEHHSMRVNSAKLPEWTGKTVRVYCKCLKFDGDNTAIMETSDGGTIRVTWAGASEITDTFVEVIGTVLDEQTVKLMACVNLGADFDLNLANDMVEMMHDARFYEKLFAPV